MKLTDLVTIHAFSGVTIAKLSLRLSHTSWNVPSCPEFYALTWFLHAFFVLGVWTIAIKFHTEKLSTFVACGGLKFTHKTKVWNELNTGSTHMGTPTICLKHKEQKNELSTKSTHTIYQRFIIRRNNRTMRFLNKIWRFIIHTYISL